MMVAINEMDNSGRNAEEILLVDRHVIGDRGLLALDLSYETCIVNPERC